jgi:hypothetical protein
LTKRTLPYMELALWILKGAKQILQAKADLQPIVFVLDNEGDLKILGMHFTTNEENTRYTSSCGTICCRKIPGRSSL